MEWQPRASSIIPTRLWRIVRVAFVKIRKGLMSKRNFINDMIDGNEYGSSCSDSPEQVIVRAAKNKRRRFPCMRLPKVIEDFVEDEPVYHETLVFAAKTPEFTLNIQIERRSPLKSPYSVRVSNYSSDDKGDGKYGQVDYRAEDFIRRFYDKLGIQIEQRSPLKSPHSVRVSNYSSDDKGDGKYGQVDYKAEEFISRFYDQLRKQIVH